MGKIVRDEVGSVAVLIAMGMVLFLGILLLSIDVGMFILEKNRLSNAVDAASLAGVQELPFNVDKSFEMAQNYLTKNIKNLQYNQITVSSDDKEIKVVAKKRVDFILAPILGITSWEIEAAARARTDVVSAISGAVPLAIEKQNFVYGKQYMLKYGPGVGQGLSYRGNFGALALGGNGAKVYSNNLAEGYSGIIRIGDWVQTETGNMAGPTAEGIRSRLESCNHPNSTYDNVPKDCKRLVIVPIVESLDVSGRKEVQIAGFGAFFLESTSRRGNENYIIGRFIRYAAQGEIGDGEDFGLKAARLVE